MSHHIAIIPVLGDSRLVHIAKASFQDYLSATSPPDSFFPLILKKQKAKCTLFLGLLLLEQMQ